MAITCRSMVRALQRLGVAAVVATCNLSILGEEPQDAASAVIAVEETIAGQVASQPAVIVEECEACKGAAPSPTKGNPTFPVVEPFQRAGNFATTNGKGYYSIADAFHGKQSDAPPKTPYPAFALMPPGFFNANFKLLEAPGYERDVFEKLKRIHLGEDWLFSVGGEFRTRYHSEVNSRLTGNDNDYTLYRSRVFADLAYRDLARVYVEYIDADNWGNDIAPLAFDENRSDLLNLFGDFKIGEIKGKPVVLRGGRQEMIYGSQRLISTLDWANNRREPFTGVKGFWHGEKLQLDAFVVQPTIFDRGNFDAIDEERLFTGLWGHYNLSETHGLDFYYLYLNDQRGTAIGKDNVRGSQDFSTIGARYAGNQKNLLFDFEGMLQFGNHVNQELLAASLTGGLGYKFADCPWTPTVWTYYDWASGTDRSESNDHYSTFNQLFPFGHYYFGFIDLVGRQNIHDWNTHLTVFPTKWLQLGFQHHYLRLDDETDFLYNAGGVATRRDPTGNAGSDVGHEFDLIANLTIDKHQSVLIGYSILLKGGFLEATSPGEDPELTYIQYNYRW